MRTIFLSLFLIFSTIGSNVVMSHDFWDRCDYC